MKKAALAASLVALVALVGSPAARAAEVEVLPLDLSAAPATVQPGNTITLTLEGAPKSATVLLFLGPNTGSLDLLYFSLGVVPPFTATIFSGPRPDGVRVASMSVPVIPPGLEGTTIYLQAVSCVLSMSPGFYFQLKLYVSNVASFTLAE
ncbi:MAG: hypothetical protein AB1486_18320 [Planctomycetota bacterium]